MEFSKAFKFIVEDIDKNQALLSYNGQKIKLPLADLRGDLQKGDALFAVFTEEEKETAKVRDMAKEILNEILNPD